MPMNDDNPGPAEVDIGRRRTMQSGLALGVTSLLATGQAISGSAAARDPGSHGFDFIFGRWTVAHRKLRQRLAGNNDWIEFAGTLEVMPILGGNGNVDKNVLFDPKGTYEATSLRLYNPQSRHWSIWWIDARNPRIEPPVVGGFSGTAGTFYSEETFEGKPIRVRTTYAPTSATTARWTQAFSPDAGATWEVNWVMDFSRA